MDFNNNNFFGGEPSRRDKLEIGNDGKTTAEKKKSRQEEQQRNFMEMENNRGGLGGKGGKFRNKFNRKGGSNYGRGGKGSKGGSTLIAIVLIAVPVVLVTLLFTGNLNGVFRSVFSTPEQNQTAFYQGVFDMQQANRDLSLTDEEQEQVAIYRKNEISKVDFIDEQVYPEYVVYVYSDSESKNEEFNNFILEAEDKGFPVPIFRISADLTKDYFITDTLGVNEPGFVIFRNNTGKVAFDSMVNDPEQFSKLEPYMEEIIKQDDEYLKNRTGSYGEAEWMNPTEDSEEQGEGE